MVHFDFNRSIHKPASRQVRSPCARVSSSVLRKDKDGLYLMEKSACISPNPTCGVELRQHQRSHRSGRLRETPPRFVSIFYIEKDAPSHHGDSPPSSPFSSSRRCPLDPSVPSSLAIPWERRPPSDLLQAATVRPATTPCSNATRRLCETAGTYQPPFGGCAAQTEEAFTPRLSAFSTATFSGRTTASRQSW